MGCQAWNGFYEKDNDAFVKKEEYLKMLESENPEVRKIAEYALEVMLKK
jgi:hypothetical protein